MAQPPEVVKTDPVFSLKAVIDIGSTSIRMAIAQIGNDGTVQLLDELSQSVSMGSDTFTRGQISRNTIEDCVKVLKNFSTVLAEYGIDPGRDVRAVATSAVREAGNRDEFLDRVYMATHINVEVIEGTEVNRLTFLGFRNLLEANPQLKRDGLLVAEIGGGSSELLGLEHGHVAFAHTYRMGAYRLRETMHSLHASERRQLAVLDMEIAAGVRQMREAVAGDSKKLALLLMGGDARLAVQLLEAEWSGTGLAILKVADLERMAQDILHADLDELAARYHLSFEEAQTFGPALLGYVRLAQQFKLKKVNVCGITLRDGLLAEAALGNAWTKGFMGQILHSVHEIGRRYHLDQVHADVVTAHALDLFHAMAGEHQLGYRHEVILTVAAQLHDIGMFIGNTGHHKHSQYIIEHSDLFGLGQGDIKLAALVARYHRRALPRATHPDYNVLPREQRLVVGKLAAILRVADALDRSHAKGARGVRIELQEGKLLLEVDRAEDFAAEKRALAEKAEMFEKVYGRQIVLRAKREQR
ncbi:MAG: HD domain-containing protein [Kiritimatiellales bacterium]|nr:HD domain-containing protein [Kiritimatiellales bacterium]